MVCTYGGADHIRLGMWRDVSPSVKPFGLATSLVRGRLLGVATRCVYKALSDEGAVRAAD